MTEHDDPLMLQFRLLDLNDRQSPTWRKLRDHFEQRLQELREKNDNDLGELATAKLRGQLAEIRYLLALGDQDPATEANEE